MKFNETKKSVEEKAETTNLAGGEAFEPVSPEFGLYKVVINNLLENKFYESDEETFEKVVKRFEESAAEDPEFPVKLAAYARNDMYLRDISQLLLVLSSYHEDSKRFVEKFVPDIVRRADELATVIAINDEVFEPPLPKPLKKGLAESVHQFNTYHFSKYSLDNRDISMVDVFNRVHPEPRNQKEEELFEKVVKGGLDDYPEVDPLEPPRTWEVEVTDAIEKALPTQFSESKERWVEENKSDIERHQSAPKPSKLDRAIEAYKILNPESEDLFGTGYTEEDIEEIRSEARKQGYREALPKMGLFAKIRNLRKMLKNGIDGEEILDDEDLEYIKDSKIYPFRFYQAYRSIANTQEGSGTRDRHVENWLNDAIELSTKNLPDLSDTFVAVDVSGSMNQALSRRSNISYVDISAFFGAVLKSNGADIGVFANDFETVTVHPSTPTLELVEKILNKGVGGSTNGWKAIRYISEKRLPYEKIVVLTDEQLWDSTSMFRNHDHTLKKEYDMYRADVNPASLYIVDLSSYGTLSMPENYRDVHFISGWNDKILDFIEFSENVDGVIKKIKKYGD